MKKIEKITIRRDPVCKIYCEEGDHELEIEINETNILSREYQDKVETSFQDTWYRKGFGDYGCREKKIYQKGIFKQRYIICPLDGNEINIGIPTLVKDLGKEESINEDISFDFD